MFEGYWQRKNQRAPCVPCAQGRNWIVGQKLKGRPTTAKHNGTSHSKESWNRTVIARSSQQCGAYGSTSRFWVCRKWKRWDKKLSTGLQQRCVSNCQGAALLTPKESQSMFWCGAAGRWPVAFSNLLGRTRPFQRLCWYCFKGSYCSLCSFLPLALAVTRTFSGELRSQTCLQKTIPKAMLILLQRKWL